VTQLFVLDQCGLMKAIVTTVSGYHKRGEVLINKLHIIEQKDDRYLSTRHSSIMGNAILIAQALSLALEVDVNNMTALSDVLEREFANGRDIDSKSQNSDVVAVGIQSSSPFPPPDYFIISF
jgi:hypothetical protein